MTSDLKIATMLLTARRRRSCGWPAPAGSRPDGYAPCPRRDDLCGRFSPVRCIAACPEIAKHYW